MGGGALPTFLFHHNYPTINQCGPIQVSYVIIWQHLLSWINDEVQKEKDQLPEPSMEKWRRSDAPPPPTYYYDVGLGLIWLGLKVHIAPAYTYLGN